MEIHSGTSAYARGVIYTMRGDIESIERWASSDDSLSVFCWPSYGRGHSCTTWLMWPDSQNCTSLCIFHLWIKWILTVFLSGEDVQPLIKCFLFVRFENIIKDQI